MRFLFNPYRELRAREFHRTLPGYAATPLHNCAALARSLELGAVWVKDESGRFGLNAFKVLGASWAMHRLGRRSVYAAATDGNHGRAVAWMAARLGARAVIFVPANTVHARIEAIRGEGAEVRVIAGTYDDAVRECARESEACGWQVVADTGYPGYEQVPRWVVEGYGTMFEEFEEQGERPDAVIVQAGVGGLLCAAVRHFAGRARIVSVEPEDASCLLESIGSPCGRPATARGSQNSMMAGLNCGEPSLTAWPELRAHVDLFIAIGDSWAREAMRRLYEGEPRIVAGESGAAGLAGLLAICADAALREQLGLTERSRVLLVNTEGATDPENFKRVVEFREKAGH